MLPFTDLLEFFLTFITNFSNCCNSILSFLEIDSNICLLSLYFSPKIKFLGLSTKQAKLNKKLIT